MMTVTSTDFFNENDEWPVDPTIPHGMIDSGCIDVHDEERAKSVPIASDAQREHTRRHRLSCTHDLLP